MRANQKKYNRKMWIIAALSLCVYAVFFMIVLLFTEIYFSKDITIKSDRYLKTASSHLVNSRPLDIFELQKKYPEISVVYFDENGEIVQRYGNYYQVISNLGSTSNLDEMETNLLDKIRYRTVVKKMNSASDAVIVKLYYNLEEDYRVHNRTLYFMATVLGITLLFVCSISLIISKLIAKPYFELANKNNQLIYDTAHEFNTPLAVINSQINNISENEAFSEELMDDIDIAKQEIKRLKRMTKDLLILARVENDIVPLVIEQCAISDVISEVVEPYQMLAESQEKQFDVKIENLSANTDADKIRQIVRILLDNALKYTAEGEGISFIFKPEGSKMYISVRDTGVGVPIDEMERIFEKFYRVDDSRTKSTGGTGIGLALLKAIVYQFGGRLIASVNRPKGLRIDVILPQVFNNKSIFKGFGDRKVLKVIDDSEPIDFFSYANGSNDSDAVGDENVEIEFEDSETVEDISDEREFDKEE